MVARNVFLLLLNCSVWHCLGSAQQNKQTFIFPSVCTDLAQCCKLIDITWVQLYFYFSYNHLSHNLNLAQKRQANFTWTPINDTCQVHECPSPSFSHASLSGASAPWTEGKEVTVTCNSGFLVRPTSGDADSFVAKCVAGIQRTSSDSQTCRLIYFEPPKFSLSYELLVN